MKLLFYPNKILEQKCDMVINFDVELGETLDEMKKVMEAHNGIGLAANQVGLTKRIIIIKTSKGETYEFINPVIIEMDGMITMQEGCLSAKSIYLNITRPSDVLLQYQDRTGEIKKIMAQGIEARTILHECEHLDGKFYFSKVNRQERKIAKAKLRKLKGLK